MKLVLRFISTNTLVLLTLAVAFTAVPGAAQISKGSISGTVVDPSGAAVPDATIKVTDVATGQAFTTTADSTGTFHLNLLPVGTYKLEATKEGFRTLSLGGVAVAVGADNALGELKLEVGAASETIEVTTGAPIIESSQAQITNTLSNQDLTNLPGVQENQGLDTLAVLLPGVSSSRDLGFSNTNGGNGFSVNGLRGRNNDQEIDGQNNNDNSVAGPAVFLSNPEFVSQYQLITNNFGPEYGRNAGSVVNIITKSGSNNWHGAGYVTEGNSSFNSMSNIQAQPQASATCPTCFGEGLTGPPHFNDIFGSGTIGGPVIKNKLFVFGGFDTEIDHSNFLYQNSSLTPTPTGITQLASCYTSPQSAAAIAALQKFGPYGIPGGSLQTISPQTVNLSGTDPASGAAFPGFVSNDAATGGCDVQMGGVSRNLPNGSHEYDWVTRVDFVASPKDTVYWRYLYQKQDFFDQDSFVSGDAALGYPNDVPSLGQAIGIDWTHQISNRMINELRLNYGRTNVEFGGNSLGNTVPSDQQLENAVSSISFSTGGLAGYGPADNAPQGRIVNTYQLQDNWNYSAGKHQLKAGINYTYQRSPNYFLPNVNGSYLFDDWNSYAGNEPSSVRIALGTDVLDFREHDTFAYFGDDFKVARNLTVNLGLTYTYYGQPANLFHTLDAKQQSSNQPFWDPSLPQSITVFPTIPAPKNSWGPGVGFAWSPDFLGNGKTVIRGGYRLAYDPPFYNIYLNIASAAPQVVAQSLTTCMAAPCGANTAGGNPLPAVPIGSNVRAALASNLTLGVFDPRNFNSTGLSSNFGPDKVHEWSFGVERELGTRAAFEARYVGNHAENLFQSVDGNPLIAGYPAADLPSGVTPCPSSAIANDVGRVDCNGYGVHRVRNNGGYSNYDGLQTEFRTNNLFNQLTMKATYTFSKTLDNVSEIFSTFAGGGSLAFAQNPLNTGQGEYGLSGLDFPHTFTLSLYEMLPLMREQHGVLGHLLGGWGVGATYIWQSGQPYTPTQFFFNTFSGGCCNDTAFDNAFIGTFDNVRPFYGNPNAPATTVGAFAGDVCTFSGAPGACALAPNTLLDWAAFNSTGAVNQVSNSNVKYILNGAESQAVFGTPFGNVPRDSARDAITNNTSLQITKNFKAGERVNITWHMSMIDAFNHPNYGYNGTGTTTSGGIDPFVDADAGLQAIGTGFGNPQVFDGGHRIIRFGLRVGF
jgi:Carboxypeptidase regulatory-like domain